MKRALIIGIGIIALTVAAGWGYLTYRQWASYRTPIPKDAGSVIQISVDRLVWQLIRDSGWKTSSLSGRADTTRSLTPWRLGIETPANFFIYTLPEFPATHYFGVVQVSDSVALFRALQPETGRTGIRQNGVTFFHMGRFTLGYHAGRAAFALSPTGNKADTARLSARLHQLLSGENMAPINQSDFYQLRQQRTHVTWLGKWGLLGLDFEKGLIRLSGKLPVTPQADRSLARPDFSADNALSLWLNTGLDRILEGQTYRIGTHTLHGDSLLRYYRGGLALEWRGSTTQRDTAITYGYNDDFELEEQVTVVENTIPELVAAVNTAHGGPRDYLIRQGIIDPGAQQLNRSVFPLYEVNIRPLGDTALQLYTGSAPLDSPLPGRSSDVFYLRMNFRRLTDQQAAAIPAAYAAALNDLEVSGRLTDTAAAGTGELLISGTLRMADQDQVANSLTQLIGAVQPKR
ncbi:hypothetical protein [Parapedobacter lycopersici]|uniref:hypothetical protein n=1 Tax=Parapedobacter lycopersici TaxID=1864939 RepID=UPI00214D9FF4|nr:hypothetical protein [Parapedobacter lycopersici]